MFAYLIFKLQELSFKAYRSSIKSIYIALFEKSTKIVKIK